jgi:ABC-2 type transport system permease protein
MMAIVMAMTALRKEVLEQWRTYRLLLVSAVLIAFGMLSPLIAKITPELFRMLPGGEQFAAVMPAPTVADAIGQYIKNINQFAFLLALLTTMGVVAQEKERGTAVLMLVKPLGRGTFLGAKFAAQALTYLIAMLLAGAAAYYYTMVLFSKPDASSAPDAGAWLLMNLLLWLHTTVYIAITLLASTIVRSQAAAAAIGFAAMAVLSMLGFLPTIGAYLPGQLAAWAGAAFTNPSATAWPAVGSSVLLIVACLLAAWAVFERQEL